MTPLLMANCSALRQGKQLLELHSDASYAHTDKESYGSSIGCHMRHVLDHYRAFLKCVDSGLLDYDARERGTALETSLSAALQEIDSIIAGLEKLEVGPEQEIAVRAAARSQGEDGAWHSSLGRELQFLVSHTIHHYALISIASRAQGIAPDPSFGIAPSTLKYMQEAS